MGESCRHQSPASISLTLPEEPPDSQASEETATASLPHGKIKGYPHSLYRFTAVVHGEPRREDARPELAFQSGRHTGRAGAPRRDPAPRPPRAARAARRRARGSPGWGRGRAARPSSPPPRPQTRAPTHAPLGSGRWRAVPLPGPGEERGQNPDRLVLTEKPWGARALPLLHASAAVAGPAPRWDFTESPSGAPGRGVEAAPGTGWGAGPPGMPPGAPLMARAAVRATRERTTPRAAAALRRPLPARRSTTGRGDPRLQQGEPRGALRLAPQPSPGAAPGGPQVSELKIRTVPLSPAGRRVAGRETQPPLTYSSVGKRTELPPVLRLRGIAQSALWGRGPQRTMLG
ncbi:hypothetical protein NN561_017717 [Cricetulus griseus]